MCVYDNRKNFSLLEHKYQQTTYIVPYLRHKIACAVRALNKLPKMVQTPENVKIVFLLLTAKRVILISVTRWEMTQGIHVFFTVNEDDVEFRF